MLPEYGKTNDIRYRIDMGDVTLSIKNCHTLWAGHNEIVTNALKYAFFETFICTVQRGEPCTITLTLQREGNNYRLMIADNGIGIPEKMDFARLPGRPGSS